MSRKPYPKPISLPSILLPKKGTDMSKWAVVACDQFTSQPDYWEKLKSYIGEEPSTYHMILPEVYLEDMDKTRINKINQTMHHYLQTHLFESLGPGMMLVERITSLNQKRLGLIVSVDLETYSYERGSKLLIRTTEETIVERIPPRVKIREKALLELSHVMLLINDDRIRIIEHLYERKNEWSEQYDFILNMFGGHIKGYHIKDCQFILDSFDELIKGEDEPMMFIVGDGNHSLATAKAHWESVKKSLDPTDDGQHPARYALVEVVNLFDPGLHFEGIHRILFDVGETFLGDLENTIDKESPSWIYTSEKGKKRIMIPQNAPQAYAQIQSFIDDYLKKHPNASIDYIHGSEELIEVCNAHQNSVGICMPMIQKNEIFPFIKTGMVLPRKSFSMGHATAKRYYLESQLIVKNIKI